MMPRGSRQGTMSELVRKEVSEITWQRQYLYSPEFVQRAFADFVETVVGAGYSACGFGKSKQEQS